MSDKLFLFLFPIKQYFDVEVERGSLGFRISEDVVFRERFDAAIDSEKDAIRSEWASARYSAFMVYYSRMLNECIDARYRINNFSVSWAVFDDTPVSKIVRVDSIDSIIPVGLDFAVHTRKRSDGSYPYPDFSPLVDSLGNVGILRIGGFHMWDCVEKVARDAHGRGLDVVVDEDLTDFFSFQCQKGGFLVGEYPNYNPYDGNVERFFVARKDKPWLLQREAYGKFKHD